MKKKLLKVETRKTIQSLYELAEETKGKRKKEILSAIWHLNNIIIKK